MNCEEVGLSGNCYKLMTCGRNGLLVPNDCSTRSITIFFPIIKPENIFRAHIKSSDKLHQKLPFNEIVYSNNLLFKNNSNPKPVVNQF